MHHPLPPDPDFHYYRMQTLDSVCLLCEYQVVVFVLACTCVIVKVTINVVMSYSHEQLHKRCHH